MIRRAMGHTAQRIGIAAATGLSIMLVAGCGGTSHKTGAGGDGYSDISAPAPPPNCGEFPDLG